MKEGEHHKALTIGKGKGYKIQVSNVCSQTFKIFKIKF